MPGGPGPDPSRLAEGLDRVLRGLGAPPASTLAEVLRQWPLVVGDDVAAHTRPRVVEGGRLIVDADHPAFASRVRFVEHRILAWLGELLGDAVDRVEVRVQPDACP